MDAALAAVRNYFERAARELHARGGRILPRNGTPPRSLQEQEEALAAWYTFLVTRLRVFKVRPFIRLPPTNTFGCWISDESCILHRTTKRGMRESSLAWYWGCQNILYLMQDMG